MTLKKIREYIWKEEKSKEEENVIKIISKKKN